MSDLVRINGNMHSWGSVYLKIDGQPYYGVKAINYGDSRERGKAWGMGRHHAPRGRSAGKYDVDPVVVTFEKDSARAIRAALASKSGGISYGNAEAQIVVQYVEADLTPITDVLHNCVISKQASKAEEGTDPLYEDIEFDCMKIVRNSQTLFDSTEGSP